MFVTHMPQNQRGADLRKAYFKGADLSGFDFTGANLAGVNLTMTKLFGAKLTEANLRGAKLVKADLTRANLERTDLTGANLFGADFRGSWLTGAKLSDTTLHSCIGNGVEIGTLILPLWDVAFTAEDMAIGCEQHSIHDWENFDDARIEEMSPGALDFWGRYKEIIFSCIFEARASMESEIHV